MKYIARLLSYKYCSVLCIHSLKNDLSKLTLIKNDNNCCIIVIGGNWIDLKKKTLGTGGHVQLMFAKDAFDTNNNNSTSNSNSSSNSSPTSTYSMKSKSKSTVPLIIPTTLDLFGHTPDSVNGKNAKTVLEFLNGIRGLENSILMRYGVNMAMEKFIRYAERI